MKRLPLMCFLWFAFAHVAHVAQAQDITVTTQEEIDNWSLGSVQSLTITGPSITSLEGLLGLLTIEGSLTIENTYNLESLYGLQNVVVGNHIYLNNNQALIDASSLQDQEVNSLTITYNSVLTTLGTMGGAIDIQGVTLIDNPMLSTTDFLSNCLSINSVEITDLTFSGLNNVLNIEHLYLNVDDCAGFESLQHINDYCNIFKSLPDFPNLEYVQTIAFWPGAQVDSFNAMPQVTQIESIEFYPGFDGDVSFVGLESINTIDEIWSSSNSGNFDFYGLEGITDLNRLTIVECSGTYNFEGLSGLLNIWDELYIYVNPQITNVIGLQSLAYVEVLVVWANENLETCCAFSETMIVGSAEVGYNLSDQCNTFEQWSNNCGSIPGCTNPTACNFSLFATDDDGSCLFIGDPCDDNNPETQDDQITANCTCEGNTVEIVLGCTYGVALNFNPEANDDDGSCIFQECFSGDLNGDALVNINDLLDMLQIIAAQ